MIKQYYLTIKLNTDVTLSYCVEVWGSTKTTFMVVVVYFYSINQIQYNIILYNIQNRKTEKVKVEAKHAYKFLS